MVARPDDTPVLRLVAVGPTRGRSAGCSIRRCELRAVHERCAGRGAPRDGAGEQPDGAVAVVDEAMVAHGRPAMRSTGDPTAHAVMQAIRETRATPRVGRRSRV